MIVNIKSFIHKNIHKIISSLFLFLAPLFSFAEIVTYQDGTKCDTAQKVCNPSDYGSISDVLTALFDAISKVGALVLAVMIVYTGYLFVTSAGNDTKLAAAKKSLYWIVIGGVVVIGAQGIAKLIESTASKIVVP